MTEKTDAQRIKELESDLRLARERRADAERDRLRSCDVRSLINQGLAGAINELSEAIALYDRAAQALDLEHRLVHLFSRMAISKEFSVTRTPHTPLTDEQYARYRQDVDRLVRLDAEGLLHEALMADGNVEQMVQRWLDSRAKHHKEAIDTEKSNSRFAARLRNGNRRLVAALAAVCRTLPTDHPWSPLAIDCPICKAGPGEPCATHWNETRQFVAAAKDRLDVNEFDWPPDVADMLNPADVRTRGTPDITVEAFPPSDDTSPRFHEARIIWRQHENPYHWIALHGIECPQCGAQPGQECFTAKGPRSPHNRRLTGAENGALYRLRHWGDRPGPLTSLKAVGDPPSDAFVTAVTVDANGTQDEQPELDALGEPEWSDKE